MILAVLFLCLLAVLLYRFRLSRETDLKECTRLLPAFIFIGMFIFIVGLFSHFSYVSYRDQAALVPTETVAAFQALRNRSPVMLRADVSGTNKPVLEDFVAYYATREGDEEYSDRKTPCLWLALSDGEVRLNNEDYTLWNWPYRTGTDSFQFLKAGAHIVVFGAVQDTIGIEDKKREKCIDAEFVFCGSLEDCRMRLKKKSAWPHMESYVSIASGTAVCVIPLLYVLLLFLKKRKAPDRSLQGTTDGAPDGSSKNG